MAKAANERGAAGDFGAAGSAWLEELRAQTAAPALGYVPALAWLLSVASTWAYSDRRTLEKVLGACMGKVEARPITSSNPAILVDTQAYLVKAAELPVAVLVFRGTEFGNGRMTDVLTDVMVDPRQVPHGGEARVHGGFFRALACVWVDVVAALEAAEDVTHLFVGGHSLGGALALLATSMLASPEEQPPARVGARLAGGDASFARARERFARTFAGLYTYGQPMVGNGAFRAQCRGFEQRIHRHVFRDDWVPSVPPRGVNEDFVHVGQEYRARSLDAPWKLSPETTRASRLGYAVVAALAFALEQLRVFRRHHFRYSLGDHIPQRYLEVSRNGVAIAPRVFP